jgi:hypothetical protein
VATDDDEPFDWDAVATRGSSRSVVGEKQRYDPTPLIMGACVFACVCVGCGLGDSEKLN